MGIHTMRMPMGGGGWVLREGRKWRVERERKAKQIWPILEPVSVRI